MPPGSGPGAPAGDAPGGQLEVLLPVGARAAADGLLDLTAEALLLRLPFERREGDPDQAGLRGNPQLLAQSIDPALFLLRDCNRSHNVTPYETDNSSHDSRADGPALSLRGDDGEEEVGAPPGTTVNRDVGPEI